MVGSSRYSTRGLATRAMPMFALFFWPPETPLIISLPISTSVAAVARCGWLGEALPRQQPRRLDTAGSSTAGTAAALVVLHAPCYCQDGAAGRLTPAAVQAQLDQQLLHDLGLGLVRLVFGALELGGVH